MLGLHRAAHLDPIAQSGPELVRVEGTQATSRKVVQAQAIRFEKTNGKSALEVTLPPKSFMEANTWKRVSLTQENKDWLAPFLNGASEALKGSLLAQLASTQTFRIVFNGAGDLMRAKSGDGFRTILVDKHSHRILSHGLLQPVGAAGANALLLWECAAVLVGRKYLADIDRRLNELTRASQIYEHFWRMIASVGFKRIAICFATCLFRCSAIHLFSLRVSPLNSLSRA